MLDQNLDLSHLSIMEDKVLKKLPIEMITDFGEKKKMSNLRPQNSAQNLMSKYSPPKKATFEEDKTINLLDIP
jgi:hypothetical protein